MQSRKASARKGFGTQGRWLGGLGRRPQGEDRSARGLSGLRSLKDNGEGTDRWGKPLNTDTVPIPVEEEGKKSRIRWEETVVQL